MGGLGEGRRRLRKEGGVAIGEMSEIKQECNTEEKGKDSGADGLVGMDESMDAGMYHSGVS